MWLVPDRLSAPGRSDVWSDPTWRYAILAGAYSIPVVLALEWLAPRWSLAPVFVFGFLVGYAVDLTTAAPTQVGFRMGAIGATGLVPLQWTQFGLAWSENPFVWIGVLSLAFAVAAMLLLTAAIVGTIGAGLGNWLSRQVGPGTVRTSNS